MNSLNINSILLNSFLEFNTNYYDGDNNNSFLLDVLTNCIGAFVGFGLSLLIYSHQIKKQKEKEQNEGEQRNKNWLKYYSELIRKNLAVAEKNFKLLDNYIVNQE